MSLNPAQVYFRREVSGLTERRFYSARTPLGREAKTVSVAVRISPGFLLKELQRELRLKRAEAPKKSRHKVQVECWLKDFLLAHQLLEVCCREGYPAFLTVKSTDDALWGVVMGCKGQDIPEIPVQAYVLRGLTHGRPLLSDGNFPPYDDICRY